MLIPPGLACKSSPWETFFVCINQQNCFLLLIIFKLFSFVISYVMDMHGVVLIIGNELIKSAVFNFTTGQQDVARVTKEAFDACNSTNPISIQTTGPANYTLSSAGEYYFISTQDEHCFFGQKLAISVNQASSGPSASPAPAASRTPVTYIVGDDLGWIVPPGGKIAYETWAYDKIFAVGDTLGIEHSLSFFSFCV